MCYSCHVFISSSSHHNCPHVLCKTGHSLTSNPFFSPLQWQQNLFWLGTQAWFLIIQNAQNFYWKSWLLSKLERGKSLDILNIFSKLQFKSQVLLLSAKHFFFRKSFYSDYTRRGRKQDLVWSDEFITSHRSHLFLISNCNCCFEFFSRQPADSVHCSPIRTNTLVSEVTAITHTVFQTAL